MKKLLALLLALILAVSLCACNINRTLDDNKQALDNDNLQTPDGDDPVNAKYKLTVIDYWGYLARPLEEYYEAGDTVMVFLAGPEVGIEINGEYIEESLDMISNVVYHIITFTMPARDSVLYTTHNGSIGFPSTFSRAGSGGDPAIWSNALNASKLNDRNSRHLPVYKFDTLADLEQFKSTFGGENGFNFGWDEVPSLNEATQHYDADFFDQYTLMLVCIEASSGSYRFGFKDVTMDGNYFCVNVEQTNNPQYGTDDMASWFVTVAVSDEMIKECIEFDAVMDTENMLDMPGTNLEFWIGENVDGFDFSAYHEKYGMFGGNEYYGKGYVPTVDENGEQVDPQYCVIYTVTSYPDYSDNEQHVTGIYITDPEISFYGISLNSSFAEFEELIKAKGFEITGSNENHRTAVKGKYSITFTKEWILIRVDVENKYGIEF